MASQFFKKSGASANTIRLPNLRRFNRTTGWEYTQGKVGRASDIDTFLGTLTSSGYSDITIQETDGGLATIYYTLANVDPANPATETSETVWELFGQPEVGDILQSDAAIALDVSYPGIAAQVDMCVAGCKAEFAKPVNYTDLATVGAKLTAIYNRYKGYLSATSWGGSSAQSLFAEKMRGAGSFQFTRWYIRKTVTISSVTSSLADALFHSTLANVDKLFTKTTLLAAETGMPTALSNHISNSGYYLKANPHTEVTSQGKLNISVEWLWAITFSSVYSAAS